MERRSEKQSNNSESLRRKVTRSLAIAFLGLSLLTGCKENQDVPSPSIVYDLSTPIYVEPIQTPFFSTDWKVCTTIQKGEGVIKALRRAAQEQGGGGEPREWSKTIQQTVEIMDKNGRVRVYSWEQLLEKNPIVYPGDKVCDTLKPHLSATATPRPEDIHR